MTLLDEWIDRFGAPPTEQDVTNIRFEAAAVELEVARQRLALVNEEWKVARAVRENFTAINQTFNLPADPDNLNRPERDMPPPGPPDSLRMT